MKKLLFALSLMFLLSACKWTGGTRGNNAEALPPQDPQDELQAAVSAMEEFFGKLADAVDDAIETGKLDTTGFNQPNVTVTHEEVQDDIQEPDAWYS